jgi:tRNA (guanine-N7-)-methyltransferase
VVRRTKRLPLEELAPFLVPVPDNPAFLEWAAILGNDHGVEIEVGFGKGLFLQTVARARPEINFLGVEIVRKYQLLAATRLARGHIPNVRLACADARLFLADHVGPASIQAVHVYFPDPWWKNRHRKRRVFTAEFARQCQRILKPGGLLHVVTDVDEYFTVMGQTVCQNTSLRPVAPLSPPEPTHDLDYLTHFERKFRKAGRPIYRSIYQR